MREVEWLEEALFDLKEIGKFIAEDDPAAAYRVLTKIETTAKDLLQVLSSLKVREDTLDHIDEQVTRRRKIPAKAPRL